MSHKHVTINQLTNIESNYYLGLNGRQCAKRMQIGKDKVYAYYRLFKAGMTVEQIYTTYQLNKRKCGRKTIQLSQEKLHQINHFLDNGWSLDAIAGRDKLMNESERVSTNTLYKLVKGGLISAHKLRRKGKNNPKNHTETRGKINDCKTIHQRNEAYPEADSNQEYGHFEGDTIVGKQRKSAIVTLVEKKSKYIVLLKASRKSADVKEATVNWLNQIPDNCIKTITFDRGKEFARWEEIEKESSTEVEIYFSDPGSPGQRGLNENSNGIVRQDLPKSTDLSIHSQEELNIIAEKYNSVPRKSLNYYTPKEIMKKATGSYSLIPAA